MRTSLVLVLGVALWLAAPVAADEPNNFQPDEISSDALVAFVQGCVESARKAQRSALQNALFKYCACVGDAQVQHLPISTTVINQCAAFANKHAANTRPVRSPYHGDVAFNVDQVVGAVLGCEREIPTVPVRTRQRFCGCVADAMRFERTLLVSEASKSKCALILKKRR